MSGGKGALIRDWNAETAALVSMTLDNLGISNILWGNMLLRLYGVPTIVDGGVFIVPDALLQRSVSALVAIGFASCTDVACSAKSPSRVSPIPAEHLHMSETTDCLELLCHSDILWKVKSLNPHVRGLGATRDIMFASDPSLPSRRLGGGCGPFPSKLYPVRIPTIHRYTEAVILLLLKCRGQIQEFFWSAMLTYVEEYVCQEGRLHDNLLPPSHKRFLLDRRQGTMSMLEILYVLERASKLEENTDSGTEELL